MPQWLRFLACFLKRFFGSDRSRRRIYRYFNGIEWVAIDPLVAHNTLLKNGGPEWHKLIAQLNPPEPINCTPEIRANINESVRIAGEQLIKIARETFLLVDLDPRTERGLTGAEALDVLMDFVVFCNELEEAARPLPNGPSATVPPASAPSITPTTPPLSASGSIDSESVASGQST